MARKRSIAELTRNLRRRLLSADSTTIEQTAMKFRELAVVTRFTVGYCTVTQLAETEPITQALDRNDIEAIIRRQTVRRR